EHGSLRAQIETAFPLPWPVTDRAAAEQDGDDVMLRYWLLGLTGSGGPGACLDPATDERHLRLTEGILFAGRHHAATDLLVKETLFGIARQDDGSRLAAFQDARMRAQVEVALARFVAMAAQAFRFEERLDIGLKKRRRWSRVAAGDRDNGMTKVRDDYRNPNELKTTNSQDSPKRPNALLILIHS